jgi:hypothetical protein
VEPSHVEEIAPATSSSAVPAVARLWDAPASVDNITIYNPNQYLWMVIDVSFRVRWFDIWIQWCKPDLFCCKPMYVQDLSGLWDYDTRRCWLLRLIKTCGIWC